MQTGTGTHWSRFSCLTVQHSLGRPLLGLFFRCFFSFMNTWRNVWRSSHCLKSFVVLALLSLALDTKSRPWKRRWRRSTASFACDEGLPEQKKTHLVSYLPAITCPNRKLWKTWSSWRVDGNKTFFILHAPLLFALLCLERPPTVQTHASCCLLVLLLYCHVYRRLRFCLVRLAAAATGILRRTQWSHKMDGILS